MQRRRILLAAVLATGSATVGLVSTSTAGFVGQTERGPTAPRLITSWDEFVRWYGSYVDRATTANATSKRRIRELALSCCSKRRCCSSAIWRCASARCR